MNENEILELLRIDDELRRLVARHYVRAERAKQMMRAAGFGWSGLDILGTAQLVLQCVAGWRPMDTAPKDGTEVFLFIVHPAWQYEKDDPGQWQGVVKGRWIDHNGGGWTWPGLCGVPIQWAPLLPALASG